MSLTSLIDCIGNYYINWRFNRQKKTLLDYVNRLEGAIKVQIASGGMDGSEPYETIQVMSRDLYGHFSLFSLADRKKISKLLTEIKEIVLLGPVNHMPFTVQRLHSLIDQASSVVRRP